jgi:hypothetical protein
VCLSTGVFWAVFGVAWAGAGAVLGWARVSLGSCWAGPVGVRLGRGVVFFLPCECLVSRKGVGARRVFLGLPPPEGGDPGGVPGHWVARGARARVAEVLLCRSAVAVCCSLLTLSPCAMLPRRAFVLVFTGVRSTGATVHARSFVLHLACSCVCSCVQLAVRGAFGCTLRCSPDTVHSLPCSFGVTCGCSRVHSRDVARSCVHSA